MLRVTCGFESEGALRTALRGLEERATDGADGAFVLYNTERCGTGLHSILLEMVEVYNDHENAWCTSVEDVIRDIRQGPIGTPTQYANGHTQVKSRVPMKRYPKIQGRLFSCRPSAVKFLLWASCYSLTTTVPGGPEPTILRIEAAPGKNRREEQVLEVLQKLQNSTSGMLGIVSCLIQGMEDHSGKPKVLLVYLTEQQLTAHWQDCQPQCQLQELAIFSSDMHMALYGNVSCEARRILWKSMGGLQLQTESPNNSLAVELCHAHVAAS